MKRLNLCSILIVFFLVNLHAKDDWPVLKGPYLGQKPPGKTAEPFAPGIVNTGDHDFHSDFYFDDRFFIFRRSGRGERSRILVTMMKDGVWTPLRVSPHEGKPWYHNYSHAEAGRVIYFAWRGPVGEIHASHDLNIWVVKKKAAGWSNPRPLKSPVNTPSHDTWASAAANRTIYFFSGRDGGFGKSDVYRSKFEKGAHRDVENLGHLINTKFTDNDPYIAPDERFLIFCSDRPGGLGKLDMYVAFKKSDGSFSEPVNMGSAVNSSAHEERPYVTPDEKYLFFTSTRNGCLDIYWVDAGIIEKLRPKEFK
jgi:Tol biopolymer transport system component